MSELSSEELMYCEKVQDFIDKEIVRLVNLSDELEGKILDEGRKFTLDNPYASCYGGLELTEHQFGLERKIQKSENAKYEAEFLKKLRSHPYFARIDFAQDGYDTEKYYFGIKSLIDENDYTAYVYDWRAPIASLFYEDFEGEKAYYDAPAGRIEGNIKKRIQYKFKDGKLSSYFESDLKVDDDILQKILSEGSTDRLKVIVSSIQKEQNRAIRFGSNKNLIVSGPAGSGKTSVGFHRLAYLLYLNRDYLSSSEIVMVTNSDIFSSYVSDIIPELGEAPVNEFNLYRLMSRNLGGRKYEDYYSLTEALLRNDRQRTAEASVKLSREFADFLEKYVKNLKNQFTGFSLYNSEVYSGEELSDFISGKKKAKTFSEKLELLTEYATEKIEAYFKDNYESIYNILNEETSILDDTAEQVQALRSRIRKEACQKIRRELEGDDFMILSDAYEKYETTQKCPVRLSKKYRQNLGQNHLPFEDALLVLYIKHILGKLPDYTDVRHVLIDEAQDFTPIQHRIIHGLYPKAKFTILTDSRQAIFPFINTVDISELSEIYSAEILELKKSYRSTKQINNFAKKLLREADYETFDRDGDEPEIIETDDIISEIEKHLESISGTACIITKTTDFAEKIYSSISTSRDVELYNNKEMLFSDKIGIMPVTYTKGLEFDNVIIVSDSENDFCCEGSEPFLYMAATRALHKLTVIKAK